MQIIDKNDNGRTIYIEMFDSPYEFIHTVQSRPYRSGEGFDGDTFAQGHKTDRPSWYGYSSTDKLIKDFQSERIPSDVLLPIQQKIKDMRTHSAPRISVVNEEMGFQADVDRVLNGEPRYMIAVRKTPRPNRCIRIFLNIGAGSHTSASEMNAAGAALIETIAGMEVTGQYRIDLVVGDTFSRDRKLYGVGIKVKSANQPMNLSRMAWPAVNASAMCRGIAFGWFERSPKDKTDFIHGYGCAWHGTYDDIQTATRKALNGRLMLSISDIIRWVHNGTDIETAILREVKENARVFA